ncbi:MAG: preprotein translocase subunit SecG [Eubacteriales bacterium]|jgi:preprotein translocase subunit SecG|nr:preprotein translocase subunit SecG [Eubacteriales bacterium]MDD4681939.1 preprotein translocase subunit SecG [Eubacteriales bacterium]
MEVATIIVAIIDIILCLGLIFLVIFQEGNSKGLGAIGGGADTFFGKTKARTLDSMLKKLTSVVAIAFAAFTVALYLMTGRGA